MYFSYLFLSRSYEIFKIPTSCNYFILYLLVYQLLCNTSFVSAAELDRAVVIVSDAYNPAVELSINSEVAWLVRSRFDLNPIFYGDIIEFDKKKSKSQNVLYYTPLYKPEKYNIISRILIDPSDNIAYLGGGYSDVIKLPNNKYYIKYSDLLDMSNNGLIRLKIPELNILSTISHNAISYVDLEEYAIRSNSLLEILTHDSERAFRGILKALNKIDHKDEFKISGAIYNKKPNLFCVGLYKYESLINEICMSTLTNYIYTYSIHIRGGSNYRRYADIIYDYNNDIDVRKTSEIAKAKISAFFMSKSLNNWLQLEDIAGDIYKYKITLYVFVDRSREIYISRHIWINYNIKNNIITIDTSKYDSRNQETNYTDALFGLAIHETSIFDSPNSKIIFELMNKYNTARSDIFRTEHIYNFLALHNYFKGNYKDALNYLNIFYNKSHTNIDKINALRHIAQIYQTNLHNKKSGIIALEKACRLGDAYSCKDAKFGVNWGSYTIITNNSYIRRPTLWW